MQEKGLKLVNNNTTAQFEPKHSPDNVFMFKFLQKTDFSQGGTWHPLKNKSDKQMTSLQLHPAAAVDSLHTTHTYLVIIVQSDPLQSHDFVCFAVLRLEDGPVRPWEGTQRRPER